MNQRFQQYWGAGMASLVIGLTTPLVGCGNSGSSIVPISQNPTVSITQFTSPVRLGQLFNIQASTTVPRGLRSTNAVQVTLAAGSITAFNQTFSPAQVGCTAGATSCTVAFQVRVQEVPTGLYTLTLTAFDQTGASGNATVQIQVNP